MDCDFSEFSYGYAAIREAETELAQIYRSAGAPVLPSLLQEEHLGWDAKLTYVEYVLFLQFKRVEFVSRRHPASPTWHHVDEQHYRFTIDTDGHQHAALCALERNLAVGTDPGHVYYAAPTFHRQIDFDRLYGYGTVLQESSLTSPTEFGENDGVHHLVTNQAHQNLMLSEPRRLESQVSWDSMTGHIRSRAATARERGRERTMTLGTLEEAVRVSEQLLARDISISQDAPITRRLERLAAILGCGLLLFTVDESS